MNKYDFYTCDKCGGFQRSEKGSCCPCVRCGCTQLSQLSENDERVVKHKKDAVKGGIFLSCIFSFLVFMIFTAYVNENYTSVWDMFDCMKEDEKTYNYSTDYSNDYDDFNNSSTEYKMWRGMNGTYTYRCNRTCSDSCKYCKNSCIKGRENFGSSCTHEYSADSPIGWIGCPLCGDVDNSYWHDWYDNALKN